MYHLWKKYNEINVCKKSAFKNYAKNKHSLLALFEP